MDTEGGNQICSMLRMHTRTVGNIAAYAFPLEHPEARHSPEAADLLERAALHGAAAAASLENSLDVLQEIFVHELRSCLEKAGLVLDERLEISLTENDELLLEGGTAENGALQEAVATNPLLGSLVRRLHRLALALRGMELLRAGAEDADAPLSASGLPGYRVRLKGALSHFYLC